MDSRRIAPGAPETTRKLFLSYIDTHLREQGVEFVEQRSVTCRCGHVFQERTVNKRLAGGHPDVLCPECETRTLLSSPAQEPELLKKTQVLRTDMSEQRSQSVSETKVSMKEAQAQDAQATPLRILHLSDLHVGAGADPVSLLQREYPLEAEQQCISLLSADTRLQFLAMNSSWEVDQWFPERSHLHEGALSRGLLAAQRQLEQARATGQLCWKWRELTATSACTPAPCAGRRAPGRVGPSGPARSEASGGPTTRCRCAERRGVVLRLTPPQSQNRPSPLPRPPWEVGLGRRVPQGPQASPLASGTLVLEVGMQRGGLPIGGHGAPSI